MIVSQIKDHLYCFKIKIKFTFKARQDLNHDHDPGDHGCDYDRDTDYYEHDLNSECQNGLKLIIKLSNSSLLPPIKL